MSLKNQLKSKIPLSVKIKLYQGLKFQRVLTSPLRVMPDFIIIGAQKCGTTTLYNHLIKHPWVAPAAGKEIHFFDKNFQKSSTWYRCHFPSYVYKSFVKYISKRNIITGEASPYYIFHPHTARRASEFIPSAKLILLLRNPVDRAFSHYNHEVKYGNEAAVSFEEAIEKEDERLDGEMEKLLADEFYFSFNHQHFSYLSRGIYINQLEQWAKFFPKKQFLVLKSEDFFTNTSFVFKRITEFLGLPDWQPEFFRTYNAAKNSKMLDNKTRERLTDYYRRHNQRLYEYLGTDFGWDN